MTSENQARDVSAHVCGQTADMVSENNNPGCPVPHSGSLLYALKFVWLLADSFESNVLQPNI